MLKLVRSLGVWEDRTDHTIFCSRSFTEFGFTRHQKVNFSTFDGRLEFQCLRNVFKTIHFVQGLPGTDEKENKHNHWLKHKKMTDTEERYNNV